MIDPKYPSQADREQQWIIELRAGGPQRRAAIAEIYDNFGERIRRYFRSHGLSRETAEDLLHQTFVRIIENIERLQSGLSFSGWIWRIAHNLMIDSLRRTQQWSLLEEAADEMDDGQDQIENTLQRAELEDCVRSQFSEFARNHPQRAQALVWAVQDRLAMSEIAEVLGRSVGATREFISQCRKKLRDYLAQCQALLD